MKKIIALLILILALPTVTALAASVASKSFVVRNWKATPPDPSPTPDPTPVTTPASTTPAPTDEVETMEPEETEEVETVETEETEEQDEEPLADDEPLPADEEQDIPHVDEYEDGQGEADESDADEAPPEPTTDEVEQSEETAAVETPADDGEKEITINTDDEPVEPEEVGEARVDIGGRERSRS